MIKAKLKSQIDAIWDSFHSGGVTNPMSVLEQMTYILFMRMLDNTKAYNASFQDGEWQNPETGKNIPYNSLRWNAFKKLSPTDMLTLIQNEVFPFIKNLGGEESSYCQYMRDAVFLVQSPHALSRIVEGVDALPMDNQDAMSDVFGYMIMKMGMGKSMGQFFSPRPIARLMVELMQPKAGDEICDPAMGDATLLVESARYIAESSHQTHITGHGLHGFDIDLMMLRIGTMNLMLQGILKPDIKHMDSLSLDNNDADKYTLCLANPPFIGNVNRESISDSLLTLADTQRSELLFISLCIRMLKKGGRCACIVPENVLYGKSAAHIALRKELVEHQRLQAVIFLPQGVFRPYTNVSTAIIIFSKTNEGGTDNVWFYDTHSHVKRTGIDPECLADVVMRFHSLDKEENRTRTEKSFLVPLSEIRKNYYTISLDSYRKVEPEKLQYESTDVIRKRISSLEREIQDALDELNSKYL